MAIEIVSFPMNSMVIFFSYVSHHRRVVILDLEKLVAAPRPAKDKGTYESLSDFMNGVRRWACHGVSH